MGARHVAAPSMSDIIAVAHFQSADLSREAMAAVRDLCDAAYGCPTQPFFDSLGPGDHLLGRSEGQIVSHLMWITRWLEPGGLAPVRTAYVEMVATHPAAQGRGYATA